MKEKIEQISLQGDGIESNDIIRLGEGGCINYGEIESEFRFDFDTRRGTCVIKYGFPAGHRRTKKGNKRSVEFETRVVSISIEEDKNTIKKAIVADFNIRKGLICDAMIKAGEIRTGESMQGELIK